jgi:hypothetical protein
VTSGQGERVFCKSFETTVESIKRRPGKDASKGPGQDASASHHVIFETIDTTDGDGTDSVRGNFVADSSEEDAGDADVEADGPPVPSTSRMASRHSKRRASREGEGEPNRTNRARAKRQRTLRTSDCEGTYLGWHTERNESWSHSLMDDEDRIPRGFGPRTHSRARGRAPQTFRPSPDVDLGEPEVVELSSD